MINVIALVTEYGVTMVPLQDDSITSSISSCISCKNYKNCTIDEYAEKMCDNIKKITSTAKEDINVISVGAFGCPHFEIIGGPSNVDRTQRKQRT